MNIIEKLKSFNVEVTQEMEKAFAGEFLSEKEVEKKLSKVQAENETLKGRVESAEETLKGFEGKNFEEITKDRDEWKRKAEETEKEYREKEAKREFDELLKELITEVKGKNTKAILANLDIDSLMKSKNQKEDIKKALNELKTAEDTSFMFVNEEHQKLEQNKAKFTDKMVSQGKVGTMTKDEILSIKDRAERREAMLNNKELFGMK